jgi:hypothetical protein
LAARFLHPMLEIALLVLCAISFYMNSTDFGKYLGDSEGYQKPWLLIQLRLCKLAEQKDDLLPQEYMERLDDIHRDMMKLGRWWEGQESQVF